MYRKTPIIFVRTVMYVQFQGQIDMSAVQNVTNSFEQQTGDDGDGHSGLSQQPAMKLTVLIDTMVLQRSA
jgi:hypothetical protein